MSSSVYSLFTGLSECCLKSVYSVSNKRLWPVFIEQHRSMAWGRNEGFFTEIFNRSLQGKAFCWLRPALQHSKQQTVQRTYFIKLYPCVVFNIYQEYCCCVRLFSTCWRLSADDYSTQTHMHYSRSGVHKILHWLRL